MQKPEMPTRGGGAQEGRGEEVSKVPMEAKEVHEMNLNDRLAVSVKKANRERGRA